VFITLFVLLSTQVHASVRAAGPTPPRASPFELPKPCTATIVCDGTYEVIDCGGGKIIKCYSSEGYQIDCNDENLDSKCAQGLVAAPTSVMFTATRLGVLCPNGQWKGCFTRPPAITLTCGASLDESHIIDCPTTAPEMAAICAVGVPSLPLAG